LKGQRVNEMQGRLFTLMVIGIGFIEALPIIGLGSACSSSLPTTPGPDHRQMTRLEAGLLTINGTLMLSC